MIELPLTTPHLARAAERRRDAEWVNALRRDPATRVVATWRGRVRVDGDEARPRAALLAPNEAEAAGAALGEGTDVFLGLVDGAARFAVELAPSDEAGAALGHAGRWLDLRAAASTLDRDEGALLAYARALQHWHARHRFCGACGAPTERRDAGHVRHCTNAACALDHHPRTDPAVIALVTHGDACLLGNQSSWAPTLYSTLAGFVEPGESLEQAVAREVMEEAGVGVRDVEYRASQPWPFPSSLMLGFVATAASRALHLRDGELRDARWFTRDDLRRGVADETLRLSSPLSISRWLIDTWLHADLGDA